MSLFKGSITCTRYEAHAAPDAPDRLLDGLTAGAFVPLSAASTKEAFGWVSVHDLLDTDFGDGVVFSQYAAFAMRTDVKRLPAALFKAMLDRECREWMAGTGRKRVPASVKREIRERLELDLLPKHLPSVSVVDVLWDRARGEVLFFSTSQKACDHFRKLFARSFGIDLRPLGPVRQALAAVEDVRARLAALDEVEYSRLFEGETPALPPVAPVDTGEDADVDDDLDTREPEMHPAGRFLGAEFLAWLWHRTEGDLERVDLPSGPVDVWIDDDVQLRAGTGQAVRIHGGAPSSTGEAREALRAGKAPTRARVGLRVGDREYVLALRADTLAISGLKVPQVVKGGDPEAVLYERLFLFEEAETALAELFEAFTAARVHPSWPTLHGRILGWMGEGAEAVGEAA